MLAAHLHKLTRRSPVRYASPADPMSLLARSRLLVHPMQALDAHRPYWHDGITTRHLPLLMDAIHQGHHEQFPELLRELLRWSAATRAIGMKPHSGHPSDELFHALDALYQHRASMPADHPLVSAYAPGTLADTVANQHGQYHMNAALRGERMPGILDAFTPMARREVLRALQPLRKGAGNLPSLLDAHLHLQNRFGGVGGPPTSMDLGRITSGVIGHNLTAREHVANMVHRSQQGVDWRPEETIPEDYHAL